MKNVSARPQYHTPYLPHILAAGLPCMGAITGYRLDATPPFNNIQGDNMLYRIFLQTIYHDTGYRQNVNTANIP